MIRLDKNGNAIADQANLFKSFEYKTFKSLSYYFICERKFMITKWQQISKDPSGYYKQISRSEANQYSTVIKITQDKRFKGLVAILK